MSLDALAASGRTPTTIAAPAMKHSQTSTAMTVPDFEPLGQLAVARSLGMFSKYWIMGQVKTRLARDVGDRAAAHIHQQFTLHLTQRLLAATHACVLFTTPDSACRPMQATVGEHWTVRPQGHGDLGQRMANAFQVLMKQAGSPSRSDVILVGADLPSLSASDIAAAFDELLDTQIVLGPASDGGYYLIGLRGPWQDDYHCLFASIPWGTDVVLQRTIEAAHRLGVKPQLLDVREDIDTVEALQRGLESKSIPRELCDAIKLALTDGPMPCE